MGFIRVTRKQLLAALANYRRRATRAHRLGLPLPDRGREAKVLAWYYRKLRRAK
jgi:hypothetical protein